MVVKLGNFTSEDGIVFESRVILDGSQTTSDNSVLSSEFESRVILDGSQTDFKDRALS